MTVVLLCLAGLAFVAWVLVLKTGITDLGRENRRLRKMVGLRVRDKTAGEPPLPGA